jgi:enamine deaminase RidA (YjgF/YER057c/UK114 family)
MPDDFTEQAELVWQHLGTVLADAGVTYADLVLLRFYLPDPAYNPANAEWTLHPCQAPGPMSARRNTPAVVLGV